MLDMGRFSDQIRDAIRHCGTTRYALASQVGVSQSALSRFMANKGSLTLDTLDKLADVLGLEVTTTVPSVKRPAPKGRRPTKEKSMIAIAKRQPNWKDHARLLAMDAHENHFESRRGVWFVEDLGVLCIYNNNPYCAESPLNRDEETKRFLKSMKAAGIKKLAYETYPLPGNEEDGGKPGYTYAMILDAGLEKMDFVANTMREVVRDYLTPQQ